MKIVYLHGFASSPDGAKARALRARFASRGIGWIAPDLNVPSFESLSFAAMSDTALGAARADDVGVIVGSSLGALVALSLAHRNVSKPLVLIAPALGFGTRWTPRISDDATGVEVSHFSDGTLRVIHRKFFDEMKQVALDGTAPPVPVTIVMGTADESVPFATVRAVWDGWETKLVAPSRFLAVEGGDHGLVGHLDLIESAIAAALAPGLPDSGVA